MVPKISVIIPIYNVQKYLQECMDSIINQTLKDIEIICIYDESDDNSLTILREYLEKDIRVKIIHNSGKSLGSARNLGIHNCSGEYIYFVDSDDWIELNTLESMSKNFSKDIDLFCFGANIISEKNVSNKQIENMKRYHEIKFSGNMNLDKQTITNMTVTVWNKIFKTQIIKSNNIFFPEKITHEDNAFFHKYAILCNKAHFSDKYFYNYRQRTDSLITEVTKNNTKYIYDRMLAWQDIYNFARSKNISKQHIELLLYLFKLHFFFDYNYCSETNKEILLQKTTEIALCIDINEIVGEKTIQEIRDNNYTNINEILNMFYFDF